VSPRFKSIVFDFGGVLITPITTLIDEVAGWHGVEMVDMLELLMGPRAMSTSDHPWHRAERGEIPISLLQAEVAPFAEAAGLTLRGDEYARLLCGEFRVHDEMLVRIAELRDEGYSIGLLTNSFKEFRPLLESKVDFELFDVVVDSSEVGHRKPEPAIFQIVAERLGVDHDQIVYLDDFAANLTGAAAAGWTTIHVTDIKAALSDLERTLAADTARGSEYRTPQASA
jgi:putative hydrolase of the HAD superfamily